MKSRPLTLLILAVTATLSILLLTDTSNWLNTLAVTIILITLILVIGNETRYLTSVLRVVLNQLRRIIRP